MSSRARLVADAASQLSGGQRSVLIVVAAVLIAFGALAAYRPDISYRMSMFGRGWQYRGGTPEPSDFRLSVSWVGGIASGLIGVGLLVFALLQ